MVSASLQLACDNAIRTARRGDTRAGVGLARHAYRLARQDGQLAELEALNALALCQTANGSYIESIATSIDAFGLASLIGHRGGAAHALTAMAGSASFILDANAVALEMLETCVQEAAELGDTVLAARVHNTFGLIYANLGRFDEGDAHYEMGMKLVENGDNRAAIFVPHYLFLGNRAYLAVQRLRAEHAGASDADVAPLVRDALERIERVMLISGAEANIDAEARAYFCLGQLRGLQGDATAALAAFLETLKRASIIRHYPRMIDTQIEMSLQYRQAGRLDDAMQALEAAYELADANRPTSRVPIICEGVAETLAGLGREPEAALYLAKARREREAFRRQNDYAMNDLQSFWQRLIADRKPRTV